jgi:SWI/SNF-related matrix-associated actin-dependent regulator 1 of chromatin subfamily A
MKQITPIAGGYTVAFDYAPYLVSAVKSIPGRRFNPLTKEWFVPEGSRAHLKRMIVQYGFSFDGDQPEVFRSFDYRLPDMPELTAQIPLKRELYPFQKQGVQYILNAKRLIVGDQPGLGKTAQAIAAITAAGAFPCLIICPGALKINWQREVEMWTSKKALILTDSVRRTWPYFYEQGLAQFFIVNYEGLKKYFVESIAQPVDERGKKAPLRLNHVRFSERVKLLKSVIADESHRVKDLKAQQTKFTKGICAGKEYILLLTGTPVVNKPKDLVSQLGIINRLVELGGYKNFVQWFCEASNRWRELNVMLRRSCFYRREKSDVLRELPPKVRQAVMCSIATRREYAAALSDLAEYLKRYRNADDEQVRRSMRGEVMVRIGVLKNISARGKIADVADYVNDVIASGEKIILFSYLHEVQAELKKLFPAAATILQEDDGATRQRNIDAFQRDPSVQVILCSIKVAGVGVTLTASSRVAFVELPWHPADCEQCEDRAHRIGQTDSVQCTYFLGKDTIDEWIYQLISEKRGMTRQITGAKDEVEESIMDGVLNILSKTI